MKRTDRNANRLGKWEKIFREWTESGLSQKNFCKERGIAFSTFCYWRRRAKRREGKETPGSASAESPKASFVPIRVVPPPEVLGRRDFDVTLACGHQIQVPADFDPEALNRLVRVLDSGGC